MSSGVTLSSATRANLLSLQDTAGLVSTTQQRLSTGKKVNSAIDNASNYFTAAGLSARSSSLSTLLDGISNGIQTIQAANQGITSIQKLTAQLKSTAQQALASSNSFTAKAVQSSTVAALTNISSSDILGGTRTNATVAGAAKQNNLTSSAAITSATLLTGGSNTDSLGNGAALSTSSSLTVNGQTITFVSGAAAAGTNQVSLTGTIGDLLSKIDSITGAGTASTVASGALTLSTGTAQDLAISGDSSTLTALGLTAATTARTTTANTSLSGLNLTVKVGTGTSAQSTTVNFSTSGVSTLDQLNAQLNTIGAQASIDVNGKLNVTTTNESGGEDLLLSGTATGSGKAFAGLTTAVSATLGGDGKTTRDKLVTDYNNLLTQINQLSADAGFNGVNLLAGDTVKVIFNEKNTSSISVKGVSTDSTTLGLSSLGSTNFKDAVQINSVLDQITAANSTLQSQAATFGTNLSVVQNRQDFSKALINVLDTGAANLTDADLNEEAANSQALTTRQSLGISALSLANQAQQGILQLLR